MNMTQIINRLESGNLFEAAQKLMDAYQFALENFEALKGKDGEQKLTSIKCMTVGTLAVVEEIVAGKDPKEFTEDDWKKIARKVSDGAITISDRDYSLFVFNLYASNIENSIKDNADIISAKAKESLELIVEDMRAAADDFEGNLITEVEYIEKCLWLSLEGLLKLLSSTMTAYWSTEYSELAQAITQFGFEFGRYKLYEQEQRLLGEYLANQQVLDEELENRFREYNDELENYSEYFSDLVKNAFDCDIKAALTGSVELARELGVDEAEILRTIDDIDDFFE